MKNYKKLLSLITVVKNDVHNIEKTIKSIISQKNTNIEYIIIDGLSKDGTIKKVNKYKKKIDKIVIQKDDGIYHAMNKGIKLAKGKYIGFCNSGDLITKGGLKTITKNLSKDIDILFATVKRHYLGKTIIKSGYNIKRLNYNFDFATSHSTGFYVKSKLHDVYGNYDTRFRCSSDYDFYYRVLKNKKMNVKSTPKKKIVGIVQKGGFSSTLSPYAHLNEETKIRIKNKQSLIFIIVIYVNSLIKIFLKKITYLK
jgi:glycosyltransferase involved in cell wall biosynthesis